MYIATDTRCVNINTLIQITLYDLEDSGLPSQANFMINFVGHPRIQVLYQELQKNPKLKFFKSKSFDVDYNGTQSLEGLTIFINEQMGRETGTEKGSTTISLSIFLCISNGYRSL